MPGPSSTARPPGGLSGTDLIGLLDAVLKASGLGPSRGRVRPGQAPGTAPLVRLFEAVHERNLASCDRLAPHDPGPDHHRTIADLDEALAGRPLPGGTEASPGRLVAEVSSRYIDLQFAMNGAREGSDVPRINALLGDLVAAKVRLVTSVESNRTPAPPAAPGRPPAELLARPYLDL